MILRTNINIRPTYRTLTNEQKMRVFDYWDKNRLTFAQVMHDLKELNLTNTMITESIDYALEQIRLFTHYREQEIRIISKYNNK